MFVSKLLSALVVAISISSVAYADEPTERAQSLFEAGIAALARGDYPQACASLSESERIDPSVGTLVKLSECEEKQDHLVSARKQIGEAIELAEKKHDLRLDAVRQRAARLDSILPKLRIVRPPPGVEVTVDGSAVAADQFDFPFGTDAGAHRIVATATQKTSWEGEVVTRRNNIAVVVIPQLADDDAARPPVAAPAEVSTTADVKPTRSWSRTAGWVLAGAGVGGLALGATFGIVAVAEKSSAHCDARDVCDPGTTSGVKRSALVSDVGWIAGGVLLAGGAALLLTAPPATPARTTALHVAPLVSTTGGGLVLGGAW